MNYPTHNQQQYLTLVMFSLIKRNPSMDGTALSITTRLPRPRIAAPGMGPETSRSLREQPGIYEEASDALGMDLAGSASRTTTGWLSPNTLSRRS